ncbi:MAG: LON peptidase substrate-binding domain-containing protein [Proteobacteria bacterium]|nr:LON peptidase substrate-binding domain-containing protein [Pseudomonadota bacterium]
MATIHALALFPLQAVLFPGGLLGLKIFEARYLDLIGTCLREQRTFGVVALRSGSDVHRPDRPAVEFEPIGVHAELIDVDSEQTGILRIRCRGTRRFEVEASRQQADGLWLGDVLDLPDDPVLPPADAQAGCVRGLTEAIAGLAARDLRPFLEPYRYDDAGWVANRWCELLPIPQAAKQKLMALPDPLLRLQLVDDYLRSQGVVGA